MGVKWDTGEVVLLWSLGQEGYRVDFLHWRVSECQTSGWAHTVCSEPRGASVARTELEEGACRASPRDCQPMERLRIQNLFLCLHSDPLSSESTPPLNRENLCQAVFVWGLETAVAPCEHSEGGSGFG